MQPSMQLHYKIDYITLYSTKNHIIVSYFQSYRTKSNEKQWKRVKKNGKKMKKIIYKEG